MRPDILYENACICVPRATYTRWFEFGGRGNVLFQAADYGAVKNFFGLVERGDAHTFVLRRRAGSQP